ncbi:transporter substrate-binding domain-containing protein [Thalassotalea sp. SU-HH00458]|uniref:substrate-binding periplasmic protein n=1 Tax=Thalassotalea sp. SU-HH00458 TaxID=3127657 RepID=UPI0031034769
MAGKLNLTLELSTMSFARRLLQIRNGQLDLIVGIQKTEDRQDEFIYIFPHYELLSYRIFTLKNKRALIQTYQDLSGKIIGVNRNSKYFKTFDNNESVVKFKARGVLQNIELLKRNRIDAFMHYEESTTPLLDKLGLSDEVVKSVYQPNIEIRHYIAISKSSALNVRLGELEQIVEDVVNNKDFLNIRLNHYAEMNVTSIVQ